MTDMEEIIRKTLDRYDSIPLAQRRQIGDMESYLATELEGEGYVRLDDLIERAEEESRHVGEPRGSRRRFLIGWLRSIKEEKNE